jgi:hypothetical protein
MAKGTCSSSKMCAMTCCPCVLDLKAIKRLANAPKFICKACGRVANSKRNLCEPAKM